MEFIEALRELAHRPEGQSALVHSDYSPKEGDHAIIASGEGVHSIWVYAVNPSVIPALPTWKEVNRDWMIVPIEEIHRELLGEWAYLRDIARSNLDEDQFANWLEAVPRPVPLVQFRSD